MIAAFSLLHILLTIAVLYISAVALWVGMNELDIYLNRRRRRAWRRRSSESGIHSPTDGACAPSRAYDSSVPAPPAASVPDWDFKLSPLSGGRQSERRHRR